MVRLLAKPFLRKVFSVIMSLSLFMSFTPLAYPKKILASGVSNFSVSVANAAKNATTTYTLTYTLTSGLSAPGGFISLFMMGTNCGSEEGCLVDMSDVNSLATGSSIAGTVEHLDGGVLGIATSTAIAPGATVTIKLAGVRNPSRSGSYIAHVSNNYQGYQAGEADSAVFYLGTINFIGRIVNPSHQPVGMCGINVMNADQSITVNTGTGNDGKFAIADLPAGTYSLSVNAPQGSDYIAPDPMDVTTNGVAMVNLGDVELTVPVKHISGTVTYTDGTPVTDAQVNANKRSGSGWASANVGPSGTYRVGVSGGNWQVMVQPQWDQQTNRQKSVDWAFIDKGAQVSFADDATVEDMEDINLSVVEATATITGKVLKPNGLPLNMAGVDLRTKEGIGVGGGLDNAGVFSLRVPAGTYFFSVYSPDPTLTAPVLDPVTVAENQTKNLGTITLLTKNEQITGKVTYEDGTPVAGASVNAWSPTGNGWGQTQTNAQGAYALLLSPGQWEVHIQAGPNSDFSVPGGPGNRITLAKDQTVGNINFRVVRADARILGSVFDGETPLNNFFGYAEASVDRGPNEPPMPGLGAQVEGGHFSLNVPAGTYIITIHTEPGSDYSMQEPVSVTVAEGETKQIEIGVKKNDSYIQGTIYDQDGTVIENLNGEIFGFNDMRAQKNSFIHSDGTYRMAVLGGNNWFMGVNVDPSSGYMMLPPEDNKVTIAAGQTVTRDFYLLKANSTVTGIVKDPDGNPLANAFVFLDSQAVEDGNVLGASSVRIKSSGVTGAVGGPGAGKKGPGVHTGDITRSDGSFTLRVPAGVYGLGAGASPSLGYISPDFIRVDAQKDGTVSGLVLTFKKSDAKIKGSITLNGEKTQAFVWAWSENGSHSEWMSMSGEYELNVTTGDVWHIGADFGTDETFYRSDEYLVDMTNSTLATQDLVLSEAPFNLPPPVSYSFPATSPTTINLADGMTLSVPANAIATSGTITITVTPTAQLSKQKTKRPLAFGYEIKAFNESGTPITANFNSDVTLTIPYTAAMLSDLGITEDDISGAYWDESTSLWQGVTGFVVDKVNDTITLTINHFTSFALITGSSDTTPPSAPSAAVAVNTNAGGTVRLSWTNPTDNDFAAVRIYRSQTAGVLGELVTTVAEDTEYIDSGLVNGASYYYTLRAIDQRGNESINSDQITVVPSLAQLPVTGRNFTDGVSELLMNLLGKALLLVGLGILVSLAWRKSCVGHAA